MLQKLYDRYICPHFINLAMQAKPIRKQREKVIPLACGRVLEIGMGSGLNLEYYNKSSVSEVFAVEPDSTLLEKAKKRAHQNNIDLNIQKLQAELMPFENSTFDTVVSTYTMCSIGKLENALEEVKRVLKKDGSFIFSEHGKSPDKNIYKWQRRLNPIQKRIGGGCHLDINIPEVIKNANFKIYKIDSMYIPGPKFLSYHYWGSAIIE
jgi:ubiquinone/menaquinone biosynthesis C-methylase UbiE|tara:strand:- start:290 stop:913 length:624 start_codon:yes stop_codon:yes gene_type:complete